MVVRYPAISSIQPLITFQWKLPVDDFGQTDILSGQALQVPYLVMPCGGNEKDLFYRKK